MERLRRRACLKQTKPAVTSLTPGYPSALDTNSLISSLSVDRPAVENIVVVNGEGGPCVVDEDTYEETRRLARHVWIA